MIGLVLLLAAQAEPAAAETASRSVTLAQLLEAADRQNVDRRITAEQHRRAKSELRQAWTSLLPSLTVQATWTHNQYESAIPAGALGNPEPIIIQSQDQLDLAARIDLPLIDTTRWMRTSIADALEDSAEERVRMTSDQIKRAVASGWYTYAAALTLREAAERSLELAKAQLNLAEIRYRAGSVPELDVLRSRAELDRNQQSIADAVRVIAVARRNLVSLTGVDPGDSAPLPPPNLAPPIPLPELEAGIEKLPAVRAAEHELRAAQKAHTASKLALVPVVGAQFTERASNAGGFTGESAVYTLGVNLGWRIDVPMFSTMDIQASNAAIALLAVEKVKLMARDQINVDYQTVRAALTKIPAATSQVEAAQRARSVAAARYEVGSATQVELIQADRDLFAAEFQHIQARGDLAAARIALQLSAGLPIDDVQ